MTKAREPRKESPLRDNRFTLRTTKGNIELEPYSFSTKAEIMRTGFIDKTISHSKRIAALGIDLTKKDMTDEEKAKVAQATNYIELGEIMALAMEVVWAMCSQNVRVQTTPEEFKRSLIEDSVNEFIAWISGQMRGESDFLAPAAERAARPQG
jgi:hypothetical protein